MMRNALAPPDRVREFLGSHVQDAEIRADLEDPSDAGAEQFLRELALMLREVIDEVE